MLALVTVPRVMVLVTAAPRLPQVANQLVVQDVIIVMGREDVTSADGLGVRSKPIDIAWVFGDLPPVRGPTRKTTFYIVANQLLAIAALYIHATTPRPEQGHIGTSHALATNRIIDVNFIFLIYSCLRVDPVK